MPSSPRLPVAEVPQADRLEEVLHAVDAVAAGSRTDAEISGAIGKVPRQGRYYRKAAELLGFIRNRSNTATLTPLGQRYVTSHDFSIVRNAVLSQRVFQRIVPLLERAGEQGIDRRRMTDFLATVTSTSGPTMLPRRVSSVLSWLIAIGIVERSKGRYRLVETIPDDLSAVEYADDEPIAPPSYNLSEYRDVAERVRASAPSLTVEINQQLRDRANLSHAALTNLLARRIRAAGCVPRLNRLIDLATTWRRTPYLFEIKSTTEENVHAQVRRGVAQLYEYRYQQKLPDARLVLVLQNRVPEEKRWLEHYLPEDRGICLGWDGDGETIHSPRPDDVPFLFSPI